MLGAHNRTKSKKYMPEAGRPQLCRGYQHSQRPETDLEILRLDMGKNPPVKTLLSLKRLLRRMLSEQNY